MLVFREYGMKAKLMAKIYKVHVHTICKRIDPERYKKHIIISNELLKKKRRENPDFKKRHDGQVKKWMMDRYRNDQKFKNYMNNKSRIFWGDPENRKQKRLQDKTRYKRLDSKSKKALNRKKYLRKHPEINFKLFIKSTEIPILVINNQQ